MRNKILVIVIFIFAFALFAPVNAQALIVRLEKPLIASKLSGVVFNQVEEKMPNVKVIILTRDWKDEIKSTKTNSKGKFSFRNLPEKLYYLRFETTGFNPLEVKVRLKRNSKAKLKFVIEIAT